MKTMKSAALITIETTHKGFDRRRTAAQAAVGGDGGGVGGVLRMVGVGDGSSVALPVSRTYQWADTCGNKRESERDIEGTTPQ